jgi:hypothetical protein
MRIRIWDPESFLALDPIRDGKIRIRDKHPVPEIIDPVFAKTSQNARFLLSENEHRIPDSQHFF